MKSFKQHVIEGDGYYRGLAKSTSSKRSAQFNRQAELDDDDPDAYAPAPGDARAKTKTSKWTAAYSAKYGEVEEEALLEDEKVALQRKADKTGISYSILKAVYDRGMAAWRTGHRPGANQQQWAYARVNSFILGGKTQKTTDADLWAAHKKGK
jgi:hypothetical protein